MVDYIKFLPEELQRKIFYLSLEHPTAKIMKPLINEINDMPTYYINFKKKKLERIGFTSALIGFGFLKDAWLEENYLTEMMLDLMDMD